MEPVTHLLTGACLGRSGFNRTTAYATLTMVLAAEAPDIDLLWGLRGPVSEFQHHRGITHTFLGAARHRHGLAMASLADARHGQESRRYGTVSIQSPGPCAARALGLVMVP